MKLLRPIITIVCLPATFVANAGEQRANEAKCVPNPPANAELQLLQGTWEGSVVDNKEISKTPDLPETGKRKPGGIDLDFLKIKVFETPPRSQGKLTITITGNSLHFHRDANFWWDTTFTLPVATNPKQLHATIKGCPPPADSIGQVVVAIFRIEDGTLFLATGNGDGEAPKTFEAAENRYELRKVPPQKKNTGLPQNE